MIYDNIAGPPPLLLALEQAVNSGARKAFALNGDDNLSFVPVEAHGCAGDLVVDGWIGKQPARLWVKGTGGAWVRLASSKDAELVRCAIDERGERLSAVSPPSGSGPPAARSNMVIQTIGNPSDGTQSAASMRNPKMKRQQKTVGIDRLSDDAEIREAARRHRRFHGSDPTRVRIFEVDDGRDEVTVITGFKVGDAQVELPYEGLDGEPTLKVGMVYSVPHRKNSTKAGTHWVHSFEEDGGKPPIHVYDNHGVMHQLGGTYEVEDWVRR